MDFTPMQIGGERRRGATTEVVKSPYDGRPVGEIAVAGADDVGDAIAIAHESAATMRRLPTHARIAILENVAAALKTRAGELAALMTAESGKPIRYSHGEVARAIVTMKLGAAEASRLGGEVLPIDLEARGEGRMCLTTRVPRGPVAAISPFNFPLNLVAHKLSPAVAAGATVVLKAPPQCPITAHVLGEIFATAGLPAGALSVFHSSPETAQLMVTDSRMKVLSFTGSDVVGWKLKSLAGKKQVLLELGGNAPCIVCDDADLDIALPKIVVGAWSNSGQVCIKVQRVLVARSRFAEFMERFVALTAKVKCGDPADPETIVGPLIEPRHVERVLSWIKAAVAGGATMHCGGKAVGQMVLPTILTGAPADSQVVCDEVFGPVTVVEPFATLDDAIAMCNASRFGLQAGLFTNRMDDILRAYRELDYGGVIVGDVPTFRVDNFPYGGVKDSGQGREGVRYAIEELTEPRVLVM